MYKRQLGLNNSLKVRNRLFLALTIAVGVFFLPLHWFELRVLLAYDLGGFIFLAMFITRMLSLSPEEIYHRAQRDDPSNFAVLAVVTLFSGTSLVAIALVLDNTQKAHPLIANVHMGLSLIAIFLSWLLIHTYFASHYARMYYDELHVPDVSEESDTYTKGLDFPNVGLVSSWDFLYFAFTIAMCYQTSDVTVTGTVMRRVTLIHSVLSFMYVSLILGLVVNLVSNVV